MNLKRIFAGVAVGILAAILFLPVRAGAISAECAILIDGETGRVLYEKQAEEKSLIASTTKIMTALVICEQTNVLDRVKIPKEAVGIEGSSMYLKEGEVLTVQELLYGLMLQSGNDAAVAMAEHIAGSEEEFVARMNQRAQELSMTNTHFVDCCGLTDSDEHHTSARDVAVMSRELVANHPEVYRYTGIWMEDITHTPARGSSVFTLSSTNKLLKQYQWATGLKTGSTSKARPCGFGENHPRRNSGIFPGKPCLWRRSAR